MPSHRPPLCLLQLASARPPAPARRVPLYPSMELARPRLHLAPCCTCPARPQAAARLHGHRSFPVIVSLAASVRPKLSLRPGLAPCPSASRRPRLLSLARCSLFPVPVHELLQLVGHRVLLSLPCRTCSSLRDTPHPAVPTLPVVVAHLHRDIAYCSLDRHSSWFQAHV
jgi:hypothetical protein